MKMLFFIQAENNLAEALRPPLFALCLLERLSAIPTDYIDLPRCPDNGSTAGADIFDTAVFRFFAPAFGGSQLLQAACIDTGFAYGFSDPCLRLRGQCRYRPSVFLVLFNMQAVGLSGGLKFHNNYSYFGLLSLT